jgi:hypothetical protein
VWRSFDPKGVLIFKLKDRSGFSIFEVLIAIAMLSVMAIGMATLASNMSKEQAAMTEKFGLLETQNDLLTVFSDPSLCLNQINIGPVDLTIASPKIPLSQILMGKTPTSPLLAQVGKPLPGFPSGKMEVSQIQLTNILPTGMPNAYVGDLIVAIDPATMIHSKKPAKVRLAFTVLPSPSLSNAIVTNCGFSNVGVGPWQGFPTTSAAQLAPSDGMLVVTSCSNCGIRISTGMAINGSCSGVTKLVRLWVSARDKYGQGTETATLPIKQDECWSVEMTNVHQSPIANPAKSVFFRSL